ncbi:hypothetical protein SD377_004446 [Cronobacter turicensis]|nr:hypothetical protein [Cronobacter turicensis]ELY4216269.1 hypothetical protein [Cronobacter turicensis]EMA1793615.1 hypothetical protein [Cronobacter turicensis]EMA1803237.1 hypothetical protein [Cronobacter turicensis]EMA1851470.1 hypothetical protein [Cronobacter turicensis]
MTSEPPTLQQISVHDGDIYEFTCPKGHNSVTKLNNQKFEILFEIGITAYRDGYTREAITSMSAALERFYEFYIRLTAFKHQVSFDIFESTWRSGLGYSERQYGAFLTAYLFTNKNNPPPSIEKVRPQSLGKKSKPWKEFRNDVTHKGTIPTSDEVVAYGDLLYQHIYSLISEIHNNENALISNYLGSKKLADLFSMKASDLHEIIDSNNQKFSGGMRVNTVIDILKSNKPAEDLVTAIRLTTY